MNKEDKALKKELESIIKNEQIALPDSLSEQKIVRSVKGRRQSDKKPSYKKWVSLAASFAVVICAVIVGTSLNNRPIVKPTLPDGEVVTAKNYDFIEAFFIEKRNEYTKDSNSGFFSVFSNSKDAMHIEAAAGSSINSVITSGSTESSTENRGTDFAQTTVQVDGVDEADILKNDGKYIYYVDKASENKIYIVDTSEPTDLKNVAAISLAPQDGKTLNIYEIYVSENKLIALISEGTLTNSSSYEDAFGLRSCCYIGTADLVYSAIIFDISDKENPIELVRYGIDGNALSSRLVNKKLYLVSNYEVTLYNDDDKLKSSCVPSYYINNEQHKLDAEAINIIKDVDENTYSVVMCVDIGDSTATPSCSAVLGGGSEIYSDGDMLYIARSCYEASNEDTIEIYSAFNTKTAIYAFDISNGVSYKYSGKVDGSILNQFSMDKYNGYFRIATSLGGEDNLITVLNEKLEAVGKLDGIAKGESIYAVRFMGDTAYVVTFKQTDPLFIIDLSKPESPTITGELKIPGFSNMLFPYSENLIIGIGKDGTDSGANNNLKISLFDVSDSTNPVEISKAVISGKDSSGSEAEHNHKAYLTFSDGSFAFPVEVHSYTTSDLESYLCHMTVVNNKLVLLNKFSPTEKEATVLRGTYTDNCVFTYSTYYYDNISISSITAYNRSTAAVISSAATDSLTPQTHSGSKSEIIIN